MLLAALVAALPIELCRDRLGNPEQTIIRPPCFEYRIDLTVMADGPCDIRFGEIISVHGR
jgi:hypothetical protein